MLPHVSRPDLTSQNVTLSNKHTRKKGKKDYLNTGEGEHSSGPSVARQKIRRVRYRKGGFAKKQEELGRLYDTSKMKP